MTTTPSSHLTAKVFAEYLQCKTKGQLLWRAPQSQNAHFTNVYCNRIKSDSADRAEHSTGRRLISFDDLAHLDLTRLERRFLIDCDTSYLDMSRVLISHRARTGSKPHERDPFLPILFVVDGPSQHWHKLLLCFSSIAISHLGQQMPSMGYVCHGYGREVSTIRFSSFFSETVHTLAEAQATLASKADVPLDLKNYCTTCEFKTRCRQIAIETDNLSSHRNSRR